MVLLLFSDSKTKVKTKVLMHFRGITPAIPNMRNYLFNVIQYDLK